MSKNREKDKGEMVSCDVVDACCGKLMVQIGIMNNLIKVSSDLKIGIAPLLKKFAEMQDNTLKEVFPHTSQVFQYEMHNKGEKFIESLKESH